MPPFADETTALERNVAIGGSFSSGHVLINFERTQHLLSPLKRSLFLDSLAQQHAEEMAQALQVFPSANTIKELQRRFNSTKAGENVLRGDSVRGVHCEIMKDPSLVCTRNILSEAFTEFGFGTAKGRDGLLYIVQYFQNSSPPSVLDPLHESVIGGYELWSPADHHDEEEPAATGQTCNNCLAVPGERIFSTKTHRCLKRLLTHMAFARNKRPQPQATKR